MLVLKTFHEQMGIALRLVPIISEWFHFVVLNLEVGNGP
jgi:hypothetical protein